MQTFFKLDWRHQFEIRSNMTHPCYRHRNKSWHPEKRNLSMDAFCLCFCGGVSWTPWKTALEKCYALHLKLLKGNPETSHFRALRLVTSRDSTATYDINSTRSRMSNWKTTTAPMAFLQRHSTCSHCMSQVWVELWLVENSFYTVWVKIQLLERVLTLLDSGSFLKIPNRVP